MKITNEMIKGKNKKKGGGRKVRKEDNGRGKGRKERRKEIATIC